MSKTGKQPRFRDFQEGVALLEQTETADGGPRRIRGVGAFADRVNQNRRIYPADVLREAVRMAQAKLTRSLGNGYLLGEADHPSYGTRVLETVVKWEAIAFNETTAAVELEGRIIPTDAGRNVTTMMEAGVFPGLSLRGYGESQYDTEKEIETVTRLELTGFDLVFEPSFEEAGVTVFENRQDKTPQGQEQEEMEPKESVIAAPVVDTVVDARLAADLAEQTKQREDAEKALAEAKRVQAEMAAENKVLAEAKAELERVRREKEVAEAIAAETAALPYDGAVREQFMKGVQHANLGTAADVKAFVESRRSEFDAIVAAARVAQRGGVQVLGPVIETAAGIPAFAGVSVMLQEQMSRRGMSIGKSAKRDQSKAALFAAKYLEAYDKAYRTQLQHETTEMARLQEAMATSDLNLPYSVMRTVIAEAVPMLVSANVFDVDTVDTTPTRLYFESYAAESGTAVAVSNEDVTADEGGWVALANKRVRPGTVNVTLDTVGTQYTEFDDYLIDYANGRLYTLAAGDIADGASLDVDYTYEKVRAGENAAIQRGKGTLTYETITLAADRLAALISDEAIAFSASQMNWDAVTRTVAMLIREIREYIDTGIFRLAVAQSIISGNSGGSWTASGKDWDDLVEKLGVAKVAVENDYYTPTAFVASKTNAERISNWTGLTDMGFPDSTLGAAGFANLQLKGLPVFSTTAMPDNVIIVVHPELVQHRVLASRPMELKGPFQGRDGDGLLLPSQEWFAQEYNATFSHIANKGGYVLVA